MTAQTAEIATTKLSDSWTLGGIRIANRVVLAPLAGMPIKTIDLAMTPVVDFSPLARLLAQVDRHLA